MKTRILFILMIAIAGCKKSEDKNTPNPDTYPTAGLVSYFNFDDNLKDVAGNTPDGVPTDGATYVTGKRGKAISFNGAGQKVVFNRKTFHNSDSISIAIWFKKDDVVDLSAFLACSDMLLFTSNTSCGGLMKLPSPEDAGGTFTPGAWTHMVITYDGAEMKCYVNNVLTQTVTLVGNIDNLDLDLTLGYYNLGYWSGKLDDLFIYKRALSAAEVTKLYNL
jgi:hypothetical protein